MAVFLSVLDTYCTRTDRKKQGKDFRSSLTENSNRVSVHALACRMDTPFEFGIISGE